jgi:hypothetical protein
MLLENLDNADIVGYWPAFSGLESIAAQCLHVGTNFYHHCVFCTWNRTTVVVELFGNPLATKLPT